MIRYPMGLFILLRRRTQKRKVLNVPYDPDDPDDPVSVVAPVWAKTPFKFA